MTKLLSQATRVAGLTLAALVASLLLAGASPAPAQWYDDDYLYDYGYDGYYYDDEYYDDDWFYDYYDYGDDYATYDDGYYDEGYYGDDYYEDGYYGEDEYDPVYEYGYTEDDAEYEWEQDAEYEEDYGWFDF